MSIATIDSQHPVTSGQLRLGRMKVLAIGTWLLVGVGLIRLDEWLQPFITSVGKVAAVHAIAAQWQNLGATPGIVCFLIAGLIPAIKDRGRTFFLFASCAATAGIVVQLVKALIGRARPNFVHDETHFYGPLGMFYHGPKIQLDSMPSGHTTAAFAMAFALTFRWPRLGWLWMTLAAGVGISRTLVDCHFPSDVVVASCFGTLIGWSICWAASRFPLKAKAPCDS
jgi:undecaprenyl-diphosphatase